MTFNILVDNKKVEAKCTLQDRELISNAKYFCDVPANASNAKQISIEPDFKFDFQDNVTLVGITPFANMYLDDIQNLDDSYDYISESNIYVIEHSKKIQYNKNNFNISGIMFNSQADFISKNFDLLIYLISGNKTQINVQCSFVDIKEVNKDYYYTLNCESFENFEGLLQTAIAFIDNDILVIYFDNYTESEIDINRDENEDIDTYRYSYENKRRPTIILLTSIIIVVLISCLVIFVFLKKRKNKDKEENQISDSTVIKIAKIANST